jgi:hypothetical protein
MDTLSPQVRNAVAVSAARVPAVAAARRMPTLVRRLVLADLALGTLYLISYLTFHHWLPATWRAGEGAVEWKFGWLSKLFDLDGEMNVPTWYSSAQLLLVGLLLGVFAWAKWDRAKLKASLGLVAAAGLFVLFSMDEVACLHENLGGKLVFYLKAKNHGSAFTLYAFWVLLLSPVLAWLWCVATATREHWRCRPAVGWKFVVGFAVFLGSAVGFELFWISVFGGNPSDSPVEVYIEEVGEMLGVTILAWAALDLLASARVTLTFDPPSRATR